MESLSFMPINPQKGGMFFREIDIIQQNVNTFHSVTNFCGHMVTAVTVTDDYRFSQETKGLFQKETVDETKIENSKILQSCNLATLHRVG